MTSYVDPKVATAILDSNKKYVTTRTTGVDVYYVSYADTARLIRSALKLAFPGVRFSVTSKSYSGGGSVRVRYIDGPSKDKVDAALDGFAGSDFDGMIDMSFSHDCYMTRSGSVGYVGTYGTSGSGGSVPATWTDAPLGAAVVHFMGYIFVDRDRTDPRPDYADYWAGRAFDAMDL